MNKSAQKIQQYWDENPVAVIAVGAAALTAVSKFIDSVSSARSKRAYAKYYGKKKKK